MIISDPHQLNHLLFPLSPGDRVFLYWPLGAGKTTFARLLIEHHLQTDLIIPSPTYNYYQAYDDDIYHFDLYRASDMSDILRIWAEDIFEDERTICIIEWPEILAWHITPTHTVEISLVPQGRDIFIRYVK